MTLVSDTSDLGWGAHLNDLSMQGLWMQEDQSLHINIMQLKAICLACQAFLPYLGIRVVQVLTAMFYINKQGSTQSPPLCQEALGLWDFCVQNSIQIMALHLLGARNKLADLSRSFSSHRE